MKESRNSPIPVDQLMGKIRQELESNYSDINKSAHHTYSWGETLQFGDADDSQSYLVDGWGAAQDDFRWTVGKSSTLALALPKSESNLLLTAIVHPMVGNQIESQKVSLKWNRKLIGEWTVKNPGHYHAYVLNRNCEDSPSILELQVGTATSPHICGINEDQRILGIGVHTLKIVPLTSANAFE